jgi:hypothetical protein
MQNNAYPTHVKEQAGIFRQMAARGNNTGSLYRKDVSHMSIALRSRQMFLLFLLALVTIFVLGSIMLNAVAHVNVWQIIFSTLKAAVPSAMYGGS